VKKEKMILAKALRVLPASGNDFRVIAFVGAGGKTTTMFQLARELPAPVIVTGTTHLGAWQIPLADEHLIANSSADFEKLSPHGVTLVTGPIDGDAGARWGKYILVTRSLQSK